MEKNIEKRLTEVSIPVDAEVHTISAIAYKTDNQKTKESTPGAYTGCIRCHTPCQNVPCICYR